MRIPPRGREGRESGLGKLGLYVDNTEGFGWGGRGGEGIRLGKLGLYVDNTEGVRIPLRDGNEVLHYTLQLLQ